MASLGVRLDRSVDGPHGVHVFRIQSELCHRIGGLLPSLGQSDPKFAQIWTFDTDQERQVRRRQEVSVHQDRAAVCDRQTLLTLQDILRRQNPYVQRF